MTLTVGNWLMVIVLTASIAASAWFLLLALALLVLEIRVERGIGLEGA